jgi:hypothetical protein
MPGSVHLKEAGGVYGLNALFDIWGEKENGKQYREL